MNSHWLLIVLFLDLFATSLLIPFLPVHLRNVGPTRLLVGVFSSIYPTVQLFSSPLVGYCSDRYGHRQTLVISLILCSFSYYFLASTSLYVIFVCRVTLGLLKHTQTLGKVLIVEGSNNEKHNMFSVLSAVEACGFMLGPVVGSYFIEMENGFQQLCNISTFIFILNSVITFCFLSSDIKYFRTKETLTKSQVVTFQSDLEERNIDWTEFWGVFVLKLFLCISLSLFYTNYAFIIIERFNMSVSMVGYTNSFQGLISVVTSLLSGKIMHVNCLQDLYARLNYCFLLLSFSLLSMSVVTNFCIYFAFLIPLSFSSTLLRIFISKLLLSRSPWKSKGSLIGMENTISSLVFFFSPFIFEICITNFGTFSVPLVTCLVTVAGASLSEYLNLTNKILK
uniref:Major facilitator superfamily (MFS) profile domain-containing protein n=1 Tax=Cuerna arida TaxID=1464854 RepID=A0A1B6H2G5_9HEMI